MEFKNILDSVSKIRQDLQEKRRIRNYSRSISPKENQTLNSSETGDETSFYTNSSSKQKIEIPTNREELVEKYSSWKCPLPRPKIKTKTYKLDAADLIASSIKKLIKKYFNEIKQTGIKILYSSKKPPIKRMIRGKSISELGGSGGYKNCNGNANITQYIPRHSEQLAEDKYSLPINLISKFLKNKIFKEKKHFFFVLKAWKNFVLPISALNSLKELLNNKMKNIFKIIIKSSASKLDLSKILNANNTNQLRYFTPKPKEYEIKDNELNKLINISKEKNSNSTTITPRLDHKMVPGKIFRNPSTKNSMAQAKFDEKEDKKEDAEFDMGINPTFGSDLEDYSPIFDSSHLKLQKEARNSEIKQSIKQLEKSNSLHKKILDKSIKDSFNSLNSSARKSFYENIEPHNSSAITGNISYLNREQNKTQVFKTDISPIKLKHKVNLSEMSNAIDET